MAEETHQKNKWEGKTSVEMKGATADQVWQFLADFCNLHKWLPSIDTCYQVEGVAGKPGMVRYCSSTVVLDGGEAKVTWAKEKLINIDEEKRCLGYEIVDNNVGFGQYEATMKVLSFDGHDGCRIEWSFVCDPIQGYGFENLSSYLESSLQSMAKRMEAAVVSSQ